MQALALLFKVVVDYAHNAVFSVGAALHLTQNNVSALTGSDEHCPFLSAALEGNQTARNPARKPQAAYEADEQKETDNHI